VVTFFRFRKPWPVLGVWLYTAYTKICTDKFQVIKERAEIFDKLKASGEKIEKKRMAFLGMLLNMIDVNQLSNGHPRRS
jgi:hypothetical protein